MSTSAKKTGLLSAGVLLLVAGLLAGAGLMFAAGQREIGAVRDLARAPLGCDTTLAFEGDGEFFVFIETTGRLDPDIAGDCETPAGYVWTGDEPPLVTLTLTSPSGDEVALDAQSGIDYDRDAYVGQVVRTFDVESTGDYVLRVESPDDSIGFAAAVGRDPAAGVGALRLGGLVAALAGLILGVGLILASRRRSVPAGETSSESWVPAPTQWPVSPPGMPGTPTPTPGQPVPGPPTAFPSPQANPAASPPPPPSTSPPSTSPPSTSPPSTSPPAAPAPNVQPGSSGWGEAPPTVLSPPSRQPAPTWDAGGRPDVGEPSGQPADSNQGWGATSPDGSTGDGERSPWAPPDA